MNPKTRYFLSLLGLAVVVASATFFFQSQRARQAEAQAIRQIVALDSADVGNQQQLEQVVAIQQQVRKRQPLSDEQVSQLIAIVNGPPDAILQAKALTIFRILARLGSFSNTQKSQVTGAVTGALKSPEVLVRVSATAVLGRLGDQQAATSILPLLNDPDEVVRNTARKALARLEKPKVDSK